MPPSMAPVISANAHQCTAPVGADYIIRPWQLRYRQCLCGRIYNAPLHPESVAHCAQKPIKTGRGPGGGGGPVLAGGRGGDAATGIDGRVGILGDRSFVGRFAVGEVEATCREGVEAQIRWDAMWEGAQDILFYRAGEFLSLGVERMLYITENLQSFGLRLEDGTIIATDENYVPLLMSGYYYSILPVFSNQF